jgi:hypothetical protein
MIAAAPAAAAAAVLLLLLLLLCYQVEAVATLVSGISGTALFSCIHQRNCTVQLLSMLQWVRSE